MSSSYIDRYWLSRDGLKLHYRAYDGPEDRPAVICLPGLTRNARDFEALAERLAGRWQVLCPDLRGRGDSAYAKDSASYNPLQYAEDVAELLDQAEIARVVSIGTSLGGLLTMILALQQPDRIAGAALNDVGPELAPEGIARIAAYVGQGRSYPTWMHAARDLQDIQGPAHPDFTVEDWLAAAKRLMVLGSNGRIVFDYDMKIAEPFAQLAASEPAPEVDLWPGFDALAAKPLLCIRGALSDLFSAETLAKMARRAPRAETVTLPRVGHAPTLDEPEAVAAIERLLAKVAAEVPAA